MSTIAVVKKNGSAAIAADTLTKWDLVKESAVYVVNSEKILRVQDSFIGIAGPSAAKLAMRDFFSRRKRETRLDSVDAIFSTWLALHRALKEEYFLNPDEDEEDDYESSRMDALIANPAGIFGVAAHRSVQEFSRFYAYGCGSDFAVGAMYAVYEDPGRSAEEIARLGVEAAAEFDDSTGPPIVSYSVPLRSESPG